MRERRDRLRDTKKDREEKGNRFFEEMHKTVGTTLGSETTEVSNLSKSRLYTNKRPTNTVPLHDLKAHTFVADDRPLR